ncbi:hypothetical protein HZA96_03035 [Candidatus Woesearchaeota archaeon]|nr:hypothetical protein [Candidatus Woesearchaeota archaeon]
MLKKGSNYNLILVMIVAIVAIIALYLMSTNSKSSSINTATITGNGVLGGPNLGASGVLKCGVNTCTGGTTCNVVTNKCEKMADAKVKCAKDSECVYAGYFCEKTGTLQNIGNKMEIIKYCVKGCNVNNDCANGMQCNTKTNKCVEECKDPDGEDITKKSTTKGLITPSFDKHIELTDECLSENTVDERICSIAVTDNNLKSVSTKPLKCPTGTTCSNGACVESCTDADNGKDYFKASTAKLGKNGAKNTDSCNEKGELTESYCENNKIKTELKKCPAGCKDGACVIPKCTDSDVTTKNDPYSDGETYGLDDLYYINYGLGGGVTMLNKELLTLQTISDKCDTVNNKITEYFCNGKINYGDMITVSCPTNTLCLKEANACIPKCSETDTKDQNVAGTAIGYFLSSNKTETKSDVCDGNKLIEYTCLADGSKMEQKPAVTCPYGCKNGACLPICKDTDNTGRGENDWINEEFLLYSEATYINLFKAGTASGPNQIGKIITTTDKCVGTTLTEAYCDVKTNTVKTKTTTCEKGCASDGSCKPLPVEPKCLDSDKAAKNEKVGNVEYTLNQATYINSKTAGSAKEYGIDGKVTKEEKDACDGTKIKEAYCDIATKKTKTITYACSTGTCKVIDGKGVCA